MSNGFLFLCFRFKFLLVNLLVSESQWLRRVHRRSCTLFTSACTVVWHRFLSIRAEYFFPLFMTFFLAGMADYGVLFLFSVIECGFEQTHYYGVGKRSSRYIDPYKPVPRQPICQLPVWVPIFIQHIVWILGGNGNVVTSDGNSIHK